MNRTDERLTALIEPQQAHEHLGEASNHREGRNARHSRNRDRHQDRNARERRDESGRRELFHLAHCSQHRPAEEHPIEREHQHRGHQAQHIGTRQVLRAAQHQHDELGEREKQRRSAEDERDRYDREPLSETEIALSHHVGV